VTPVIRINLLPPEIIERRKAESRRLIFLAVGLAIIALLGIAWAFLALGVSIKTSQVASAQQQAANLRAQADAFKVFEDRTTELQSRQAVVDKALVGRVNWSRLMDELSLVLPPVVWLDVFDGEQAATSGGTAGAATLGLSGWSLQEPVDKANGGFKSMAQLLVRLNDLEQLDNVWLTGAEVKPDGFRSQDAIQFITTSMVVVPSGSSSAAGQ
jgi:Tfp pilus assembly protein PilN